MMADTSKINAPSKGVSGLSEEMQNLLEQQQQIEEWLRDAEQRIYELEGTYLEETPLGNIVRGWEVDCKPLTSTRGGIDEKERIFSNSSYQVWVENRSLQQPEQNIDSSIAASLKYKKARRASYKRESEYDDITSRLNEVYEAGSSSFDSEIVEMQRASVDN